MRRLAQLVGKGILLTTVLLLCRAAIAAPAPGVELPKGERAMQLAFTDPGNLLVLAVKGGAYALRRIHLPSGELEVVATPRGFSSVQVNASTQVLLSPAGNGLAVLEPATGPLQSSRLLLYCLDPQGQNMNDVGVRLAKEFDVGGMAWAPDGKALFVSAAPYLSPEQEYSIGRIDLPSGKFTTFALKDSVDLVDAMAVQSASRVLVKCHSYRGEYPAAALVALVEEGGQASILDSNAGGLRLVALGDGTVLALGRASGERWALPPGASKFSAASLEFGDAQGWAATPDGAWLGVLTDSKSVGAGGQGTYLLAQQRSGDKRLTSSQPVEAFALAADGSVAAAIGEGGGSVLLFSLSAQ